MGFKLNKLQSEIFFVLNTTILSLLTFSVLRFLLLFRNYELSQDIPLNELVYSFIIGVRFDLIVVSYVLIPLSILMLLPRGLGTKKVVQYWLMLTFGFFLLLGVIELDFYHEFHNRLNNIAFQYIKEDPTTVASMLWNGFPIVKYLLLWCFLFMLFKWGIQKSAAFSNSHISKDNRTRIKTRALISIMLILLLIIGARGGTVRSGPPLRWGDAFHSNYLFANHLTLNGSYTFIKALKNLSKETKGQEWIDNVSKQEALTITRKLLLTKNDTLINSQNVLRISQPNQFNLKIKNIVVILMESFAGSYVGALGNDYGITPEFDKLSESGLLFERFFSNGTHTHQGMFATFSCFPNVPGFEYLMQQPQGRNNFSGLANLLKQHDYNDLYIYNGDFSWDNQMGFFKNQGMTRFIGRDDYINPKFQDDTWGVSDEDMFMRAADELKSISNEKPFFAMLQTLSNHTPYALPKTLPFKPVDNFGEFSEHLTAMKYSDWALGQFFKSIKDLPLYNNTLFVILGDHGFGTEQQISDIDLLRFHVPMLFVAPGLQQNLGKKINTVTTQVDVVPTIMGLLGHSYRHQCWGRNIFSLEQSDPGFGVIKPSGSDQTVAFIRGDTLLVKQPNIEPKLGRYFLTPSPTYHTITEPQMKQKMEHELSSYIETALHALYENQTGLE